MSALRCLLAIPLISIAFVLMWPALLLNFVVDLLSSWARLLAGTK